MDKAVLTSQQLSRWSGRAPQGDSPQYAHKKFTKRERGGPEDKKHLDFLEKHESEKAPECRPLAEIKTRDLVYQTLFVLCTLTSQHKNHLHKQRLSHKRAALCCSVIR